MVLLLGAALWDFYVAVVFTKRPTRPEPIVVLRQATVVFDPKPLHP